MKARIPARHVPQSSAEVCKSDAWTDTLVNSATVDAIYPKAGETNTVIPEFGVVKSI